ncbi:MAG TPA: hypothetical protein VJY39_12325 [Acidisphaera sp.]|nr:hypothetical protein [Acidisphaera sp.]
MRLTLLLPVALTLAACGNPNVRSARGYSAPPVRNPIYDPFMGYGEANATWMPPVFNRDGTIVKPAEPASQDDRPAYETAPWATGAWGGARYAPPGTF